MNLYGIGGQNERYSKYRFEPKKYSLDIYEDNRKRWHVGMNAERTEFDVCDPLGCETPSYHIQVGPNGLSYTESSGGLVAMVNGGKELEMALKPEQYEAAGLHVAGCLIGIPLGLMFPAGLAA